MNDQVDPELAKVAATIEQDGVTRYGKDNWQTLVGAVHRAVPKGVNPAEILRAANPDWRCCKCFGQGRERGSGSGRKQWGSRKRGGVQQNPQRGAHRVPPQQRSHPLMVQGISKSRAISGDNRPLAQRSAAASTRLTNLGGLAPGGPMTESVLVDVLAEIDRLSKKSQVWDERLNGARIDLDTAISDHQQFLAKVAFEQRGVSRLAETDEYRILGTITDAMLRASTPTQVIVDRIAPKAPRQPGLALPGAISKPDFGGDVTAGAPPQGSCRPRSKS